MNVYTLYPANDNLVEVTIVNNATGGPLNAATVTGEVLNPDDSVVVGSSFTASYVSGSDGIYQGVIQDTANLVPGTPVRIHVVFDGGAPELQGDIKTPAVVMTRTH